MKREVRSTDWFHPSRSCWPRPPPPPRGTAAEPQGGFEPQAASSPPRLQGAPSALMRQCWWSILLPLKEEHRCVSRPGLGPGFRSLLVTFLG